jgi:hypothetical protein
MPRVLSVSRVQGQVFDPLGRVVPGAEVSLVSGGGASIKVETGAMGEFRFNAAPGRYVLKVVYPAFQFSSVELTVRRNLWNLLHPSTLRVILGVGSFDCPWVTTRNREFQAMIRTNNKRLKEAVQTNATQK